MEPLEGLGGRATRWGGVNYAWACPEVFETLSALYDAGGGNTTTTANNNGGGTRGAMQETVKGR